MPRQIVHSCYLATLLASLITLFFSTPACAASCAQETTILDNHYIGACGYTQTTSFVLSQPTTISRIRIWYDASVGGFTPSATLTGPAGYQNATSSLIIGGNQWTWYEALWPLDETLSAGTYSLTFSSNSMCANPSGETTLVLYGCAAVEVPRQPFDVIATSRGPASSLTLDLMVNADSYDIGMQGSIFLGAFVPNAGWFLHDGGSWQYWNGGPLPAYFTGIIPTSTMIPVVNQLDVSSIAGTEVFAGYGLNVDDMFSRGLVKLAYTIPSGGVSGGTFGTGDFVVTIDQNSIPPEANASPVATAETAVPSTIKIQSHETNVTAAAQAYTLQLGPQGFSASSVDQVRIEIPFDRSKISDATKIDSLHVLLRVLNSDDNSVVDLTGIIDGNKVVASLTGFPASATFVVLYNPEMREVVSSDRILNSVSRTSPSWGTRKWVVVYDEVVVANDVQIFLGLGRAPTSAEIAQAVKAQIADHAADAAATYIAEGFRSPNLYTASSAGEPGGATLGTVPRYLIHYQTQESNSFRSADPNEAISPEGNHYGRIYIKSDTINRTIAVTGMTVYAAIAHEMLHAVQSGYNLIGRDSLRGVREGSATAYGVLLDARHNGNSASIPQVRMWLDDPAAIKAETFNLEVFLLVFHPDYAYANQDFFVYLARTLGNNNYGYLATLFEQVMLTIEDQAAAQPNAAAAANFINNPPLTAVFKGVDAFLTGNYSKSLAEAYKDFARQRAMEHSQESQFGRPAETTSGLAVEMFNNFPGHPGMVDVQINPKSTTPTIVDTLEPLERLSARALRVKPIDGTAGGDIIIRAVPSTGAFGSTLAGLIYRNGVPAELQVTNHVSGFGVGDQDELILLLFNPSLELSGIGVTCEISSDLDENSSPFNFSQPWSKLHWPSSWDPDAATINFTANVNGKVTNALNPNITLKNFNVDNAKIVEVSNMKRNEVVTVSGTFNMNLSGFTISPSTPTSMYVYTYSNPRLVRYVKDVLAETYPDMNFTWEVASEGIYNTTDIYVEYTIETKIYTRENESDPFTLESTDSTQRKEFHLRIDVNKDVPDWGTP